MSDKTFRIMMSDRCFRFKPDAIPGHAPAEPGVYEFVTFDAARQGQVLYVGLAKPGETIQGALVAHFMGERKPTADELFAKAPGNVYFDFVRKASEQSPEDLKDIAAAMIAKSKPPFNAEPAFTGRYAAVQLDEVELM
jgi:hypothetical protein